jgi:hypothetical protein
MHIDLLFNGCSHTEGGELEGIERNYEYQRLNRFSHIVSERLNKTYENISISGESNDRIVRTTIDWFESGNTCDVAIIQFTDLLRFEWFGENGKQYSFSIWNAANKNNEHSNKMSLYYKLIDTEGARINNYYKNIFLLETYFELRGIKYYFMNMADPKLPNHISSTWKDHCKNQNFICITNIIGTMNNPKNNIYYCEDLYSKNKKDPRCRFLTGGHPNALGHQKIAEHIISAINISE